MKEYFNSVVGLIGSIIGLIGGLFWAISSDWDWEPSILICGSFAHAVGNIVALLYSKRSMDPKLNSEKYTQTINNSGSIKKQINIQKNEGKIKM